MRSKKAKVLEETNNYFPRDWEEFYYDCEKVKAIKKEMDTLVEKLFTAVDLAENDGSMARQEIGIRLHVSN